jgi:hypothetical protein
MASGVSKADVFLFHNLGMFDTWEKLKPFLERFIPASFLQSPSGYRLEIRMREYLLGRWVDTFIFPRANLTGDRGEPIAMAEPEPRVKINVRDFEWNRFKDGEPVIQLLVPLFDIA